MHYIIKLVMHKAVVINIHTTENAKLSALN